MKKIIIIAVLMFAVTVTAEDPSLLKCQQENESLKQVVLNIQFEESKRKLKAINEKLAEIKTPPIIDNSRSGMIEEEVTVKAKE